VEIVAKSLDLGKLCVLTERDRCERLGKIGEKDGRVIEEEEDIVEREKGM
jgi:hypothetical protein